MRLPIFFSIWLLLSPIVNQATESNHSQISFDRAYRSAVSLHSHGEHENAILAISKALNISRRERSTYNEGRCLLRLGILSWDIGEIQDSSSYFNAAKTAFAAIGDRISYKFCSTCVEIASLYCRGKADRDAYLNYSSLKRFEQAILLGRELGLPGLELKCLRQKGLTYWQLGEFNHFLECNRRGLEIASRINHIIEIGRCLNNIGAYYQKHHDYSLSLAFFERALFFIIKINDLTTQAECLSNIGVLYRELGNYTKAIRYLSEALELDKSTGNVSAVSTDLENIGSTYLRRGLDSHNKQDFLRALEVFNGCLSLPGIEKASPIIMLSTFNNIGIIKSEFGEHVKAREYFSSALAFVNRGKYMLEKCNILNNIAASYYYDARIDMAIEYYKKGLELASKNSLENAIWESCLGMGQCYEAVNEPSKALLFYKQSIDAMEQVRGRISSEYFKIGFARNKMKANQRVLKLLSDAYFDNPTMTLLEEIFRYIEKAKARAFFEGIIQGRDSRKSRPNLSEEEKKLEVTQHIDDLSYQLTSLNLNENDREKVNLDLEAEEEKYLRLISEIGTETASAMSSIRQETPDISWVRSQLIDGQTGLLEYFIGDDRSYLVYISRKNAKLYELPNRNDINVSLRAYIKMVESRSRNNEAGFEAAKRIASEILPLAEEGELKGLSAIIIVPDGILHYLPFETLPADNKKHNAYLIEEITISYCPSVSMLNVLKRPRELSVQNKELLALGGPIYKYDVGKARNNGYHKKSDIRQQYDDERYEYSPLPFSEKEVLEIGKLFPRSERNILIGKEASEGVLKNLPLEMYRIIHFACHGFLNEKYPFRSSLALSPGDQQGDDGLLQMREIYNLEINADLVVLSACYSGNGVLERTEGPIGLTRPFFYAGARSVISSLWPINDKASVYFMKHFYRFLVHGHNAAKALQLTKKRMLRSVWSRPYLWASFILSGDPQAVSIGRQIN